MPATYDPALSTDRDWVRFLIGDRNAAEPFFQDEEIDAVVLSEPNRYLAAAMLGSLLLNRGLGVIEKAVDDLRLRYDDNGKDSAYQQHIDGIRRRGCDALMPAPKHMVLF